ncbi:hypothetical protein ASE63_08200 [Bosea sp. Root381]|uniref:glycosyltransferase n=1 Tax=Bosea sp. Root381 TaxID=1736524 RepID=UPI0006F4E2CC|nr:glycosyltransferase [Bosea sp. Root381]KRE00074.1 hypothetical protein ASE63_08200 [Bosea sp. Root381]
MRVVLANKHFLGLSGGAERNMSDMANWLITAGHQVYILSETKHGETPAFPVSQSVKIVCPVDGTNVGADLLGEIEPDPGIRAWAKANRSLRKKWGHSIRAINPDVILTFMPHTATFLLYELGYEYPIIVTNQNDPEIDYYSGKHGSDEVDRHLRIELLRRARTVHFLMPAFPERMPEFVRQKSVVIPNAVPLKTPSRPRSCRRKIIGLGRLVPQKGFSLLIEAFCASQAYKEGWDLHIFGSGPEEEALLRLVRRLMAQRQVFLRGQTDNPDIELEDADVFVIPSFYEGWGLALTEAMAAGLPAIGFEDCPGVNWLLTSGENGTLVERSVNALAVAIDQLASDPALRQKLGEAGRQSVERFAPRHVYDQWAKEIARARSEGLAC